MISRRGFMKLGAASGAAAFVATRARFLQTAFAAVQGPRLPGNQIPQFVDPLPSLHIVPAGPTPTSIEVKEFQSKVMPTGFVAAGGPYLLTWPAGRDGA